MKWALSCFHLIKNWRKERKRMVRVQWTAAFTIAALFLIHCLWLSFGTQLQSKTLHINSGDLLKFDYD